ncbi:Helix-turn-helix domain protein [Bacillus sp. THAF10]|nr:Helix-turn-helix domain protein [Bacillus sp. THAF10]
MNISSVVADYLRNWLKENDKSYSWLANELKVSKSLVQHLLSGARTFTSERILQVSDVLGISVEELLNEEKKKRGYSVQLRGKISTREGESALNNVIFSCLKDDEIYYANEIFKKGIKG